MIAPFHQTSNFIVICESLGEIAGYYHKVKDQKLIHVNERLTEWARNEIIERCALHAGEKEDDFFLIMNNTNNVEHFKTPAPQ